MYDKEQILGHIKAAGIELSSDAPDSSALLADIGIDSLDTFNLFMEIEQGTGVNIPDDAIEDLTSLDKIIEYVNAHGKG